MDSSGRWQLRNICWADTKGTETPIPFSIPFLLAANRTSSNFLLREVRLPSKISPNYFPVAFTALLKFLGYNSEPSPLLQSLCGSSICFCSHPDSFNYIHEPVGLACSAAFGQVTCFSKPTSELDLSPVGKDFLSSVSGSSLPQLVQGYFLPQTELCTPIQPPTSRWLWFSANLPGWWFSC